MFPQTVSGCYGIFYTVTFRFIKSQTIFKYYSFSLMNFSNILALTVIRGRNIIYSHIVPQLSFMYSTHCHATAPYPATICHMPHSLPQCEICHANLYHVATIRRIFAHTVEQRMLLVNNHTLQPQNALAHCQKPAT